MAILKIYIQTRVFLRWPYHPTRLLWTELHPVFEAELPFGLVPLALRVGDVIEVHSINDIFLEPHHFEGGPEIGDWLETESSDRRA